MNRIDHIREQMDLAADIMIRHGYSNFIPVICETYIPDYGSAIGHYFNAVPPAIGTIIHNSDHSTSVVIACPLA